MRKKGTVELLNELKTDLSFGELKKLIYSGKKMFDVLKNTKLLDNVKNDDEANKNSEDFYGCLELFSA